MLKYSKIIVNSTLKLKIIFRFFLHFDKVYIKIITNNCAKLDVIQSEYFTTVSINDFCK